MAATRRSGADANRRYHQSHPWIRFRLDLVRAPHKLWMMIGEARSMCEQIAGAPLRPGTAEQLQVVYLSKGVHATTSIEGNTLTEEQVQQQVRRTLVLPGSQRYLQQEVQNIIDACREIADELGRKPESPLTSGRVADFNALVLRGLPHEADVDRGKYRTHSVGVMDYRGAPWQDCEYLVGRLCAWLEGEDFHSDDPGMKFALVLLRAVLAHLYLAWIHPFGDGNGRTARLVEFLLLARSGLVPVPAAHLFSNHYNKTRTRYYAVLGRSSKVEDGAMGFFEYAVEGFVDGLREQLSFIRDQQLQVTWEHYVHEQFQGKRSPVSERLEQLVLDMPEDFTPRGRLQNVSPRVARAYATAGGRTLTRDLESLRRMGLVVRSGSSWRPNRDMILAFLPPVTRDPSLEREGHRRRTLEPVSEAMGPPRSRRATDRRSPGLPVEAEAEDVASRAASVSAAGLSGAPAHPWDGYLTGPENELAMAAAQAMARGEAAGISPLVVHGPSGVGKSRLLAGLVAERLRREPGTVVAHLDAETFAASYAEAAGSPGDGRGGDGSGDGWPALRARLREADLLILEDLEGLARAPSARDELAHTLDALEASGASVAVSARTPPGTWPRREWPVRLLSRLQGGLTARIDPPGLAARRRYVLNRAGPHGLTLLADAVERLASAADGYRTLDGWLARLALEARIGSRHAGAIARARALDAATVNAILAEEALLAGPAASIDGIARTVAARFGVRLALIRGPSRRASVVAARHLAMHLARELTGSSFAAIGAYFGDRDPATVRHACRAALERLAADPALAAVAAAIAPHGSKNNA